ncbi:hypothetical protein GPECTOR_11g293 [Gonium pectorale]|uniref:Ketoreductase domain-containing protein n=1 Tax=Gonium pectorale TaxID=33097 RepID=A0A150GPW9_GONPE|nr:hypothetical protein GPECTOR_11g293 [Gonium pectorale]|eukprot:KXZ51855.1 hypothetical protein GPECTOR_11g293 [Gonium pectorale]
MLQNTILADGRAAVQGRRAAAAPSACALRSTRQTLKVAASNEGGPNYRVPINTNVNAPSRLPLPSFLQPSAAQQPAMTLTPAVEGAFKATGRTVVITGGSQGIGRATALLFARKGYNVVVAARDPGRLDYVVADCAAAAGRAGAALAVPTDVTQERQVAALVNKVLAKFETVDAVIHCAGVMARGSVEDTPLAAFLPVLLKGGARSRGSFGSVGSVGGRPSVVFLTGFSGKVPTKAMGPFSASKAALESLAATLRTEVEGSGVHVGVVQPGLVKSNLMERAAFYGRSAEEDRKSFRQMLRSLPVAQTPAEVADAVYSCVTSKANEVAVGLPFAAAAQAYKLTGLNPSAVPFT